MVGCAQKIVKYLIRVYFAISDIVLLRSGGTSMGRNDFHIEDGVLTHYFGEDPNVVIPPTVKSIGDEAFSGCTTLVTVFIPSSVKTIGWAAFNECKSLKMVSIPPSVETIDEQAFAECTALEALSIPSSVTSICDEAFYGCESLNLIEVDPNNPVYDSRGNCNAIIETATNALILGCKTTKIPNTVTSIAEKAFASCKQLKSIFIPASVKSIGFTAFDYCEGLSSVSIPNSVVFIGEEAFANCDSLRMIFIPSSVKTIEKWAFFGSLGLNIYCAASKKPDGWDKEWNPSDLPVEWGAAN